MPVPWSDSVPLSVTADSLGALVWSFLTFNGRIQIGERHIAREVVSHQRNKEIGHTGVAQLGRLARGRTGAEDHSGGRRTVHKRKPWTLNSWLRGEMAKT